MCGGRQRRRLLHKKKKCVGVAALPAHARSSEQSGKERWTQVWRRSTCGTAQRGKAHLQVCAPTPPRVPGISHAPRQLGHPQPTVSAKLLTLSTTQAHTHTHTHRLSFKVAQHGARAASFGKRRSDGTLQPPRAWQRSLRGQRGCAAEAPRRQHRS